MPQYCTILSPVADYQGVVETLRAGGGEVEVVGEVERWRAAIIRAGEGTVTFNSIDDRDAGELARIVRGVTAFVNRVKTDALDSQERVKTLLARCQWAMGVVAEPSVDAWAANRIFGVARQTSGMVFNGTAVLDAEQRLVLDENGRSETSRLVSGEVGLIGGAAAQAGATMAAEPHRPTPPSPLRVARRALVLVAMGYRGLQEYEVDASVEERHRLQLAKWVRDVEIMDEMSDDEHRILITPVGGLTQIQSIWASWRFESAAMLAWALGRMNLPPHDQEVEPKVVADALAFLRPGARALLASPQLVGPGELERVAAEVLAVNWRLREFVDRGQAKMDFAKEAAATKSAGWMDVRTLPMIDGDLALGGQAVASAASDLVQLCLIIAQERGEVMRWLVGESPGQ